MDAKMINPFLHATLEILKEVASIDFNVGTFYVKKDIIGLGDVTGIIGLTGSGKGTVAVTFDERVILAIVSKILDEEMKEINDLVIDAAGELTNMITGRVVDKLARKGFDLMLSVPTVVHGAKHRVIHHTKGPKIVIPFTSSDGRFSVEFSFDQEPEFNEAESGENSEKGSSKPSEPQTPATVSGPPLQWGVPATGEMPDGTS